MTISRVTNVVATFVIFFIIYEIGRACSAYGGEAYTGFWGDT